MSGKQLNSDQVKAARLDEIKNLNAYDVYEKVPIEECWESTSKSPIEVKWVDINKGDDVNPG